MSIAPTSTLLQNAPTTSLNEAELSEVKKIYDFSYKALFESDKIEDIYNRWVENPSLENKDKRIYENISKEIARVNSLEKNSTTQPLYERHLKVLESLQKVAQRSIVEYFSPDHMPQVIKSFSLASLALLIQSSSFSSIFPGYEVRASALGKVLSLAAIYLFEQPFIKKMYANQYLTAQDFAFFKKNNEEPLIPLIALSKKINRAYVTFPAYSEYFTDVLCKNLTDSSQYLQTSQANFSKGFEIGLAKTTENELLQKQSVEILTTYLKPKPPSFDSYEIENPTVDEQIKKLFTSSEFKDKYFTYKLGLTNYQVHVIYNPTRNSLSASYDYVLKKKTPTSLQYLEKKYLHNKEERKICENPFKMLEVYEKHTREVTLNATYTIIIDKKAPEALFKHLISLLPSRLYWSGKYLFSKISNGDSTQVFHQVRTETGRSAVREYISVNDFDLYQKLRVS